MKKFLHFVLASLLLCSFWACNKENEPEQQQEEVTYKLTVTPPVVSLYQGDATTIKWTLDPEAKNVEYKLSSDDEDVATVTSKGVVSAGTKYGEATITIKAYIDGNQVARGRCNVEVVKDKILLSKDEVTLVAGKSASLTAKLDKAGTTVTSKCTWKSSDASVATVSAGTIKAVAEGECDITATYDGVNAVCHVTVLPLLTITPATANILAGETVQLSTNIPGSTYSSSNTSVATVSDNGLVTGEKTGSATITATNGTQTATMKLTVDGTLKIFVDGKEATDQSGQVGTKYKMSVSNTTSTIQWSSDDPEVAKVVGDVVTICGKGTAYIRATNGYLTTGIYVTGFAYFKNKDNKWIEFAPGNLYYKNSQYYFFEEQFSYNANNSDLFGWGTGNNPTQTSLNDADYATFTDWGSKTIKYKTQTYSANTWKTPTPSDLMYLTACYSVTVNGINGFILLPTGWIAPEGVSLTKNGSYSQEQWRKLDKSGCVFLPGVGYTGNRTSISQAGKTFYWLNGVSGKSDDSAYALFISTTTQDANYTYSTLRHCGLPVRLIRIVK